MSLSEKSIKRLTEAGFSREEINKFSEETSIVSTALEVSEKQLVDCVLEHNLTENRLSAVEAGKAIRKLNEVGRKGCKDGMVHRDQLIRLIYENE